ncbi:MAG: hypothetical protein ACLPH3_16080 [Terracidiphilus sp.]
MRKTLVALSFLLASPLFADSGQRLIPAGSLISCTLSEPKISSKNTAVGDPILCQVGHSERYGRSVMPYNSYLVGRFEDFKDPGHFVGKGWMELRFDRMVVEPDTIIPIDARVVDVPGYRVDSQGRILGKGHEARDIALWCIPVLWPVDLIMLPMRGPRPTLKEETRVTLKVMDDLAVPINEGPQADPYGLMHRQTGENDPPPPPQEPEQQPAPEPTAYDPPQEQAPPQPAYAYAPAPPPVYYAPMVVAPPPPVFVYGSVRAFAPVPYAYGYAGYGYRGTYRAGYGAGYPAVRGNYGGGYGYGARGPAMYARSSAGYARGGAAYRGGR